MDLSFACLGASAFMRQLDSLDTTPDGCGEASAVDRHRNLGKVSLLLLLLSGGMVVSRSAPHPHTCLVALPA